MHDILPIFVTDGGEEWYDVAGLGAKMPRSVPADYGLAVRGTSQPAEFVTHAQLHDTFRPKGRLFLSNDHAATYAIAMANAKTDASGKPEKLCMIVFDAHIDLYGTSKKEPLNKANDFRALDELGMLERIIFVGAKASEELVMRKHRRKVDAFNRKFAARWREAGTFGKIGAKVGIIPTDGGTKSFGRGLEKALELAKGCSNICIDVDLDVFDRLEGVDYDSGFPKRLEGFVRQREEYARKNKMGVDKEKVLEILGYARFAKNEIAERGIAQELDLERIRKELSKSRGRILFFHVTEYDEEKDRDGNAAKTASELLLTAEKSLF